MTQCIDMYTGVFTDNIDKKKPGAAFGAVMVNKHRVATTSNYDPASTYLQIWMKNIAEQLDAIAKSPLTDTEVTMFVHTWTPNINKMCVKMQSVFDQLKSYDEDAWDVLDIKLRRANRQRYEYHNDMVTIVKSLLVLNRRPNTKFSFQFVVTSPRKQQHMGVAYQKAELAHNQG